MAELATGEDAVEVGEAAVGYSSLRPELIFYGDGINVIDDILSRTP